MILLLFALAVIALACYSQFINKIKGLPPGPPPLPVIGNFLQFEQDMDKVFIEWKKKYGKVFTVWMPHPTVVLSDHKLLQEHIVKNDDKFADRINPTMLMKYRSGGDLGLVFNDNNIWKDQRRFALHTLRDIGFNSATMQNTAVSYAQEIIGRWKEQGTSRQPVDVTMGIMVGVSNIIWQQTFGRTLSYDDPLIERAKNLSNELVVRMSHPVMHALEIFPFLRHFDRILGSPIQQYVDCNGGLHELINKELAIIGEEFNEDDEPRSYADAFMREMKRREDKREDAESFTRPQLIAACYDLWIAGFETTVNTLRFTIHHMVNRPEVQRKAQAEIDEKVGKRTIRMEDQRTLHYCNAIIQEVQRLANIVTLNLMRKTSAPVTIEGYAIPAGTGVIPEFSIVHLDEDEFARPDYFCPERHLNERCEFVKDPRITPFSVGKRACLGEGLARMELFLYFTTFIQHIRFSSATKIPPALNLLISFTRSPAPYEVIIESRD